MFRKLIKKSKASKELDPNELLPFCMRCFNVGAMCDEHTSFCHMCGSENTCINVKRADVKYMQENIDLRIDKAVEYGKKQAEVYTMEDCKKDTIEHINQVKEFLIDASIELLERAEEHDKSKLASPELEIFTEFTPKLKNSTYLSDEYKQNLQQMQKGLQHHYAHNSHHPEHYKKYVCDSCFKEYKEEPARCDQCQNGQFTVESDISQMDLFDLVEMICDWKAAVMRHADGDIMKSLEGNKSRFKIDDQLQSILVNTVVRMEAKSK
ncbi:DUF5662 family protein [Heyndrickxia sporothermodurans]|uniref:DUF5662 family protein n=1 Tax=Heyndrickxia sporothermodurans TaxID=46224 RepID=UPI00196AB6CE|nr:DUF5662 family protein [Heyndrickxia sporothermodurans]